jgi:hypothetical protein
MDGILFYLHWSLRGLVFFEPEAIPIINEIASCREACPERSEWEHPAFAMTEYPFERCGLSVLQHCHSGWKPL